MHRVSLQRRQWEIIPFLPEIFEAIGGAGDLSTAMDAASIVTSVPGGGSGSGSGSGGSNTTTPNTDLGPPMIRDFLGEQQVSAASVGDPSSNPVITGFLGHPEAATPSNTYTITTNYLLDTTGNNQVANATVAPVDPLPEATTSENGGES